MGSVAFTPGGVNKTIHLVPMLHMLNLHAQISFYLIRDAFKSLQFSDTYAAFSGNTLFLKRSQGFDFLLFHISHSSRETFL